MEPAKLWLQEDGEMGQVKRSGGEPGALQVVLNLLATVYGAQDGDLELLDWKLRITIQVPRVITTLNHFLKPHMAKSRVFA